MSTTAELAAQVEQAPVQQAPVQQAPAKQAPAKQAPAKQAPAKQAPAKQAPAKQAPAKQAPAKPLEVPEPVRQDATGPSSMAEPLPGPLGLGSSHGNRQGWPHRAGEPEPWEMQYEAH